MGEGGGEKFVGHCLSVMHEFETIQIFKFSGGRGGGGGGGQFQGLPPLYETLALNLLVCSL